MNAAVGQVGSWSLSGLIHSSLGLDTSFFADLVAGRVGIVVDALDEAHLRAGTANFFAFLSNVAELGSGFGLRIVLFSRPDTANLVELSFAEQGVEFARATLAFFDQTRSEAYIATYMRQMADRYPKREYGVVDLHPRAFAELRDARMLELKKLLAPGQEYVPWSSVSNFLGYAPVLSVVAETLAVANPHQEAQVPGYTGVDGSSVLRSIVDHLLERERQKFDDQVAPRLRASSSVHEEWAAGLQLYAPDEQLVRLASIVYERPVAMAIPSDLPPSARQAYERDASQFLLDHPFLVDGRRTVNSVIADYLAAKVLLDPLCQAALERAVNPTALSVGPFFEQFVYDFASAGSGDDLFAEVDDALLDPLLASYNARRRREGGTGVALMQASGDQMLILPPTGTGDHPHRFISRETSGVIEIRGGIVNTFIYSDGPVILGDKNGRFILGPSATISCTEIQILSAVVSVDPGGSDLVSILQAPVISYDGDLSLDVPVANSLEVLTVDPWPAFRPYAKALPSTTIVSAVSIVDLRSILISFRQGAGAAPSVYYELMDKRILGSNARRKTMFDRMLKLGIVEKSGSHYYLNLKEVGRRGIDLRVIDQAAPSAAVLDLIAEIQEGQ